jgi:hypothetical protein
VSTASTIADYIRHKRSLGIRFDHGATVLSTFSRSVGKMPLRDIRPETITRFINREGISAETMAKQHGVLAGFFRYAVTRRRLKASPMPSFESRRCTPSFTPYIYSEAELKRLLAAVPAATGHTRCGIHADILRTFVLRRGASRTAFERRRGSAVQPEGRHASERCNGDGGFPPSAYACRHQEGPWRAQSAPSS